QGKLPAHANGSFYELFIAPWNTAFAWATGVFACCLFAFEGAALLAAEVHTREDTRREGARADAAGADKPSPLPYLHVAARLHFAAFLAGGVVFIVAWLEGLHWLRAALHNPLSSACLVLATLLVPAVAWAFQRGRPWTVRLAASAQLMCVLIGFFGADYPVLLR